jgi:D-alanine-D-alanine ligase
MQKRNTIIKTEQEYGNKHIAVLMGGLSQEREVSLSSSKGVIESLKNMGYKVSSVDVGNDFSAKIAELNPDVAFNALHGTYGEDGTIPAILNLLQIPYTHAGRLSSAMAFDKLVTRQVVTSYGIKMPDFKLVKRGEYSDNNEPMQRPYVVKPIAEGSSVGVKIYDQINHNQKFSDYDWKDYDFVIVEKYIPGKEVQAAVVNDKAIGAIEIISTNQFYDYEAKYTDGKAVHVMPANVSAEIYKKILDAAELAHKVIGLKTISRSDFRVNPEEGIDGVYFLEINSHPGFTPLSLLPEISAYHNITFDDLVKILIDNASWEK